MKQARCYSTVAINTVIIKSRTLAKVASNAAYLLRSRRLYVWHL